MKHSDYSSLDEDEVAACPECEATTVRTNAPGSIAGPEKDICRYQCWTCDACFDAFDVRETRGANNTQSGLAKRLLEADADEVSQ
jgi:hypothetical protein